MNLNKNTLLIASSALALILILFIQVNWMFETAKVKEALFNEKANMVLSRTVETLGADKETCMKMGQCCLMGAAEDCKLELDQAEVNKIDSLLKHYMSFYNFHIDYRFEVIQSAAGTSEHPGKQHGFRQGNRRHVKLASQPVFVKRLEEVAIQNGVELKLVFPEQKQFIRAEMGPLFLASVLLLLLVLLLFWRSVRLLQKEKKISEHLVSFLNNMTHEFKTPLTNIALAAKLLGKQNGDGANEKLKHYTDIILDENNKLRMRVEQVLGMSALERGELSSNKEVVDFHQVLHSAIQCMSLQIESKNGSIQARLQAMETLVLGDATQLTNMLCNLLDNAIKYANETPQIEIESTNIDGKFVLCIRDKGIGIAKEYRQEVFEKFFRVPTGNLHNVKGFGIGLAYVKQVVRQHGGSIDLQSEPGKGSSFTLYFPLHHG